MDNKSIWEATIREPLAVSSLPHWPCPRCKTGRLLLEKIGLVFRKNRDLYRSVEFNKDDFGENLFLGILVAVGKTLQTMQWYQARFSGFLHCDNKDCGEFVAVTGRAELPGPLMGKQVQSQMSAHIVPEYFSPSLQLFNLRDNYPAPVRAELIRSFTVFFNESNSAGARLRCAIERLLDERGVAVESLHNRLVEFSKSENELGDLLQAIKWLGNEGSHSGKLTRQDVLDGYEVFNHVLDELYIARPNRTKMLQRSNQLTEKFMPKRKDREPKA